MRPYEIAIIFDIGLEEHVIAGVTEKIAAFVKEKGGIPGHIDRWGRRPFAYEIAHRTEGYYVFIEVVAEPTVVAEVDRMLTLSDDILRHRIIRQDEHVSGGAKKNAPAVVAQADATPVAS